MFCQKQNHIRDLMVSILDSGVVDREFKPLLGQNNNY